MERTTAPTGAAAGRHSTASAPPPGNTDGGEEDDGEEAEEEKRMSSVLSSSVESASAAKKKPSDTVAVKMAGVEITQRQENNSITTTTTTSSTSSSSSSSSHVADSTFSFDPVPPPPPPLHPPPAPLHPPPPPPPPPSKSTAAGSRSSEGREAVVHRVTFAEPWTNCVHSDSGIVLSPDDAADCADVTGRHRNDRASSDDESGDVDDDDDDDVRDRLRVRLAPVNANAVPGPPIIKLHRSKSTESRDNPFQLDGELRRKADYIITHSTFQRTYVRVSDPDQVSLEATAPDWPAEETVAASSSSPATETMSAPIQAPGDDGDGTGSPSPPVKPQRGVFRAEEAATPPPPSLPQPLPGTQNNGDMEEPLLSTTTKEGNGLGLGGSSKRKLSKSKMRDVCCVVL